MCIVLSVYFGDAFAQDTIDWETNVQVSCQNTDFVLTMGGSSTASDGFDLNMDAPAAPPGMTFYACFQIADFPYTLTKDIRSWTAPYATEIVWNITIANAGAQTVTLLWAPENLPQFGAFTLEGLTDNIDMRAQNTVDFMGNRTLMIRYKASQASLTILQPNGGETYEVGSPMDILWTSENYTDLVTIVYSINGGQNWMTPPLAESISNSGFYSCETPATPSDNCLICIFDPVHGTPADISDAAFSIVQTSEITLFAPNGGEIFPAGSQQLIQWENTNFSSPVTIELSLDGGTSWEEPIIQNYTNSGSFDWGVPYSPSDQCLIRIKESTTGIPVDVSDALFTIALPPLVPYVEPETIFAGTDVALEIIIGSADLPVTDIFGLSLDLNFGDSDFITVKEPVSDHVMIGPFFSEPIVSHINVDEQENTVSVGISRLQQYNAISGSGIIFSVHFETDIYAPDGTIIPFEISNVVAIAADGSPILLESLCDELIIQRSTEPVNVWPGDTNNDGVVTTADVLPLGLHYHRQGNVRPDASNNWIAQVCLPWNPESATYADADGNGIVDTADIIPLSLNYGNTHSAAVQNVNAMNKDESTAQPVIRPTVAQRTGDTLFVDIEILDAVDLFGLAYDFEITGASALTPVAAKPAAVFQTKPIFLDVVSEDQSAVSVGLSRKAGETAIDENCIIAQIILTGMNDIEEGTTITMEITNVCANDCNGTPIEFTSESAMITTDVSMYNDLELPSAFSLCPNWPNPFNPVTNIRYQIPEAVSVSLKIYNMMGQEIITLVNNHQKAGNYELKWHGKNSTGHHVNSGIYLLRLEAGTYHATRKVMLMR